MLYILFVDGNITLKNLSEMIQNDVKEMNSFLHKFFMHMAFKLSLK